MEENMVVSVANALDISEHRVFELAHQDWFSNMPDGMLKYIHIEIDFKTYMDGESRPPYWVNKFCNNVLDKFHNDTLNPTEFGVHKKKLTLSERNRGHEVLSWLALWLVAIAALTTLVIKHTTLECMTLLCY